MWSNEERAVYIHGSPGVTAPPEREAALAIAVCRINCETPWPGFRLWPATAPHPNPGISYTLVVMLDHAQRVATNVIDRALAICFGTVVQYAGRLEAIASGQADPGTPSP